VTSYLDTALAVSACSTSPSLPMAGAEHARLTYGERPSVSTARLPLAAAGEPSPAAAGLRKHSQLRFAMAGITANVWPLSPQDWSSG